MRICRACGIEKILAQFPEQGRTICRVCRNLERIRKYRELKGPPKPSRWDAIRFTCEEALARQMLSQKKSKLKLKYGITLEEFEMMKSRQNDVCAICQKSRPLTVDHCHTTGKVRMLLCNSCNRGLGCFDDDPVLVLKAAHVLAALWS